MSFLPRIDHEVEVHDSEGDSENVNKFVALVRFKSFHKHVLVSESISAEFVARGWCSRLLGLFLVLTPRRTLMVVVHLLYKV